MAGAHQGRIELREHLLGAAHGVVADRGEREGDAQNASRMSGPAARRAGPVRRPGLA